MTGAAIDDALEPRQRPEIEIRDATAADEAAWRDLWGQYLAFYKVQIAPEVTDQTWSRCLDPASPLTARLAVAGDRILGFAMYHHHLSTWAKGPDCYLEDLFLCREARGLGLGQALMDDLVAICKQRGFDRLYWHTDVNNHRARKLYDKLAAADGHVRYRISF
jgi:GNAT superfamily N-acetyltransferase